MHPSDPAIDEIRQIRHEMSAEAGHDPLRLIEIILQVQERHKDRLLAGGDQPSAPPAAA